MTLPNADASAVLDRYRRVAVIGAGVIGSSWTALFLAHGLPESQGRALDDVSPSEI